MKTAVGRVDSSFARVHTVADDDELQVIAPAQHCEALDVLLRSETTDEADDRLAVG